MGLFGNKKKTPEDILAMIAELSEEDRASLVALLANETGDDDAPAAEDAPAASAEAEEEAPAADDGADEDGEPALEDAPEDAAETDPEPEPTPAAEAEGEAAEPSADEPVDAPAETPVDVTALFARMEKLEETIKALAQRIGAAEESAAKKSAEEDEDPFGLAFGAEHKSEDVEDDLERAKREAGFNF